MRIQGEAPAGGLEAVPLLLSGAGFGARLPAQLMSIFASLGMTLLTLGSVS